MYTELYLSCEIKKDIPKEVKNILYFLFDEKEKPNEGIPKHEFFSCSHWDAIGSCSSHYFTPFATSKIIKVPYSDNIYLTTRFDLKNYNGEINKFLDWLMPYISNIEGEHIGHYRYEEDLTPTLIFKK